MKKSLSKLAACVLCLSVFATGCYKESIDQLQQQIDELQINSLIQQVAAMQSSVDGLASLKDQLKPAVEKLQEEKSAIEAEIQKMMAEAGDVTKLSAEQKAKLADLQNRMEKVENTISSLEAVNADLDVRIAAIEEIINTPESGLKDRVTELEILKQNFALATDLATIRGKVDDMREAFDGKFVAALEDLKDQISQWVSESTEIKNLFNNYYDCAYIDAALAALKGKDEEQDGKILGLASSIDAVKKEIQESVLAAIDGLYDEYDSQIEDINDSIDAFKKNFDDIVAALWDKIGREDLAIEGTIVSVINTLIERFGTLDGKTGDIDAIASALRADLDVLRSDFFKALGGDEYNNETLAGLHALLNELQGKLNEKADNTKVDSLIEEAKKLTADVQAALEKYITENNDALEAYIKEAEETYYKKADVEALKNTYASVEALSALDAKYQALEEKFNTLNKDFEAFKANETTIMGMIQKLNDLVGIDKEKKGWTNTIVEAVNDLYVLLGQKLNKDEVTGIAYGIVNGFINEILGVKEGGTAAQVKALLDGFAGDITTLKTAIETLEGKIGLKDLEAALGDDKDIAAAIANIKSAVADIKAELEDLPNKYAAKEHNHTSDEISDLATTIKDAVEAITGKLADLKTTAKETLVAAINELLAKFDGYYTKTEVNELLSTMQSILAAAIMDGTGLEGYFASLNLTALKDAIDDILEADTGTLDTRIKAAIDALDVDQYLTEAELLDYDYATHTELQPAMDIAAAMATLKVTLGSTTYEYNELDDAIEAIYSALQGHISNYDSLKGSFDEVEGRLDAVEALIGDGFDEEYTIKDAVDAINTTLSGLQDLIGDLGSGNTVQSLYEGLQDLYDALVNALVGKTSGGSVTDIDSSNNLIALKASLDAIGFNTIRGKLEEGGKELSLAEVLGEITKRIDALESTIGITVTLTTGDANVIAALNRISTALGLFDNTEYESTVSDIEDDIQDLLDILSGKTSGAEVSDLPALATLLSTLSDRLDNFNGEANETFEEVVDGMSDDIDDLYTLLGGDVDAIKKIFGNDFVSMADELYELKEYIYGDGLSKNIAKQATEFIRQYLSVDELLEIVGNVSRLRTESKTLVGAINELLASFRALGYAADEDALNRFRKEILFGSPTGSGDYESLKELGDLIDQLVAEIGTQPAEFANTSVYAAISALRSALTDFENEIGEGDGSVWDAIDALYELISGSSSGTSLAELIHSLVYIPEFADGRATVKGGNLEMSFALSADESFDIDDYTVSFAIKEVQTRAGSGESITATASLSDDGILTVTASGVSTPASGAAQAAVVISEKDDSDSFISQYVPLYFID